MAPSADDPASVQQARARARRRLIGAVVLLAIGVIVFPILFETKPRALPSDIPIHVSRRDSGMVVTTPAPAPRPTPAPAPPPDAGNEGGGAAAEPSAPAASVRAASSPTAPAPTASTAAVPAQPPEIARRDAGPTPAPKAEPARPPSEEASAPARTGRYVVQVGAFTDALAVREARQKVEKLGLKTYTQDVDTPTGRRTRVRVGPFDSKADADQASAKLKAAGLPVYLLLL